MPESKILPFPGAGKPRRKVVEPTQAAIDALPLGSGDWVVRGIPGLVIRCGARSKTFRLIRRVAGRQVKRVLGELSLAEARRQSMTVWRDLKPKPPGAAPIPALAEALDAYIEQKQLSARSAADYRYMLEHYLPDLLPQRLDVLALDRAGFRTHFAAIAKKHGAATAALTLRVFRAVFNWTRKVHPDLPESPTTACSLPRVKPRDWALNDDELRAWWAAVSKLAPVKRAWWLTALLTGARAGSVTNLKWKDVDFEKRLVRFRVVKGDRPYAIPLASWLEHWLRRYRDEDWLPNEADWIFPSPLDPTRPLWPAVRNRGVASPHHLRHTMRTRLAEVGTPPDLARVALGHALVQGVSERYITGHLLVQAVRPFLNAVADRFAEVMGWGKN